MLIMTCKELIKKNLENYCSSSRDALVSAVACLSEGPGFDFSLRWIFCLFCFGPTGTRFSHRASLEKQGQLGHVPVYLSQIFYWPRNVNALTPPHIQGV